MGEGTSMNEKKSKLAILSLGLGILSCCVLPIVFLIDHVIHKTWLEHVTPIFIGDLLYFSVFFVAPLMGISAFILGLLNLIKIKTEIKYGKKIAIAGMLTGLVSIVTYVVFLFFVQNAREAARRSNCFGNLKQISMAIRMYSMEYKDMFPDKDNAAGFEMLRSGGYLECTKMYTCPSTKNKSSRDVDALTDETVSYLYASGLNESSDHDIGIACDKPGNHKNYGNIIFVDGHGKGFSAKDWINSCNNPKLIELYRKEEQMKGK